LTGHPFVSLGQVLQGGMLRNTFPACSSTFASIVRLSAIFREVLPSIGHHLHSTILSQLSTIFVCAQSLRPFQPPLRLTIALFRLHFSIVCNFSPSIAHRAFFSFLPPYPFHRLPLPSCYNSFVCCNVYAGVLDRLCSFAKACVLPLCHDC
jgi:hypothetical protein